MSDIQQHGNRMVVTYTAEDLQRIKDLAIAMVESFKAMPMPGRVACERASPMSERLRRRRKVPTMPEVIPSRLVLTTTRRVL